MRGILFVVAQGHSSCAVSGGEKKYRIIWILRKKSHFTGIPPFTSKPIRYYVSQQPRSKILSEHRILMGCCTSCFPMLQTGACERTCFLGPRRLGGVGFPVKNAGTVSFFPLGVGCGMHGKSRRRPSTPLSINYCLGSRVELTFLGLKNWLDFGEATPSPAPSLQITSEKLGVNVQSCTCTDRVIED